MFGMREVTVVDLDQLGRMYQNHPSYSLYTQVCKGTSTKCKVCTYTNNVLIIAMYNTQWRYVIVYKER